MDIVFVDVKRVVHAVLIVNKHPDLIGLVVVDLIVVGRSFCVTLCVIGDVLGMPCDQRVRKYEWGNVWYEDLDDPPFLVIFFDVGDHQ